MTEKFNRDLRINAVKKWRKQMEALPYPFKIGVTHPDAPVRPGEPLCVFLTPAIGPDLLVADKKIQTLKSEQTRIIFYAEYLNENDAEDLNIALVIISEKLGYNNPGDALAFLVQNFIEMSECYSAVNGQASIFDYRHRHWERSYESLCKLNIGVNYDSSAIFPIYKVHRRTSPHCV